MMLLAIIATPLTGVLTASIAAQKLSRERTLAQQAAMTQIEAIRAMPYTSIGIANGNPQGTVQPTTALTQPGLNAVMRTQITYVNDPPVSGGLSTYADYKKIVVTITRLQGGRQLAQEVTYIPPPGKGSYAGLSQAVIKAQVIDMDLNQPVPGATVSLATGPSAPRADTTDSTGSVIFPDLTPNPTSGGQAYYDLAASANGYQQLKDDTTPNSAAHVQLTAGQTFTTVLRVYLPATIVLSLFNSSGGSYAGTATFTVSSTRGQQSFTGVPPMTITSIAGEPVVPGIQYTVSAKTSVGDYATPVTKLVPDNYPSVLTSSIALTLLPTVSATVTVKKSNGRRLVGVSGATVTISGGPASVNVSGTTDASGQVVLKVPAGSGYTVTSSDSSGGSARWTGNLTTSQSLTLVE